MNPWTEKLEENNAALGRILGVERATVGHWKRGDSFPLPGMVEKIKGAFPEITAEHIHEHWKNARNTEAVDEQ